MTIVCLPLLKWATPAAAQLGNSCCCSIGQILLQALVTAGQRCSWGWTSPSRQVCGAPQTSWALQIHPTWRSWVAFLLSRLICTGVPCPCVANAETMQPTAAGRSAQVGTPAVMAGVADTVIMHELGSALAQHAKLHRWIPVLPCCTVQSQLACRGGEVRLHMELSNSEGQGSLVLDGLGSP